MRGKRKGGEKLKLCRNCIFDKLAEYLETYNGKAVFVYPMKDKQPLAVNAYQFYTFDEMKKYKWSQKYIDSIRQILPAPNTSCQACATNMASFAWCSPEIYSNNYTSVKLNSEGTYRKEYLCSHCILDKFKEKVTENDSVFEEFNPPIDADGFATSFET
ncbi:MAG: hypothetical protein JRN20_22085 [Nitrososphaerota archaeon]|nr:hypothetical protein [Nitrososphaerota archaeon]